MRSTLSRRCAHAARRGVAVLLNIDGATWSGTIAGITIPLALVLALAACTPAARTTAGSVIRDVGAAAPLVCSIPGTGGSVCGQDIGVVSDVAKLVADILTAIPAMKAAGNPTPQAIAYRGTIITLPPGVSAADVSKRLP